MCGRAGRCPACHVAVRIPYPAEPGEPAGVRPTAAPTDEAPDEQTPKDPAAGEDDPPPRGAHRGWATLLAVVLLLGAAGLAILLWLR